MGKKSWWTAEFTLVFVMLVILTILVAFILWSPMPRPSLAADDPRYIEETKLYFESTLDYRKNILAIILTAFGAWVGAGAAYFFGRENLRESSNSLLQFHRQMTGHEKLGSIKVKDIPPKPLDIILDETIPFREVIKKFTLEPKRWFLPVQTANNWIVLNDEALYLYLNKKLEALSEADPGKTYLELRDLILGMAMKEVMEDIKKHKDLVKLMDQFLPVTMDAVVADVNGKMEELRVFLALVMDETGKFTHYFTTNDIRKALLKV